MIDDFAEGFKKAKEKEKEESLRRDRDARH